VQPAIAAILEGDGSSIWPTLGGQPVHDAIFCEIGYDRAAVGPVAKLVARDFDPDRPINTGVTSHRATRQLYNLTADPNEVDNLLTGGTVLEGSPAAVPVHVRLGKLLRDHIAATRMVRTGAVAWKVFDAGSDSGSGSGSGKGPDQGSGKGGAKLGEGEGGQELGVAEPAEEASAMDGAGRSEKKRERSIAADFLSIT